MAANQKMIRVTLVKSTIGYDHKQGETARALGLRKLNKTVIIPDTPTYRGMINKIIHLVKVEDVVSEA